MPRTVATVTPARMRLVALGLPDLHTPSYPRQRMPGVALITTHTVITAVGLVYSSVRCDRAAYHLYG